MSASLPATNRLRPGARLEPLEVVTVNGVMARLPDAQRLTHVQFRRFAGCPVCDLHLRDFARRAEAVRAAGVREIVIFHSSAETLRPYVEDLPFDVVADPSKALYRKFGVDAGWLALLDRRAWGPILRAILVNVRDRRRPPGLRAEGGRLGLPADFLIAAEGRLLACKYGEHAYDQWSVEDLLALARNSAGSLQAAE
jgi:peroxiredoxin